MNNLLLSALYGAIDFMPHWIMWAIFGLIVASVTVFIIFKGIKRGVKFIILALILVAGAYLAYLGWQMSKWKALELITFAISWGPTVLFVLIVMTATFVNAKRGLRKSLILALHAVCAAAVSLAFFFICVSIKEVDNGLLSFINLFMGDGGLQRQLGVSESIKGFKEVLCEAIPKYVGNESDFGILLSSNTAYLYTLVDMIFKVVFAVLALLIYFPLIFILYIIYHLCYSQRKYKRTKIAEFQNGMTDKTYRKHHIGGGVVGLVRGLTAGLLCMSFLGSAFFMVAGGKGEGTLGEKDYGDDNVNGIYTLYRSIESYGAQGIFKVLNTLSDTTDTPYYLFAADLILSGELTDEEAGVSQDVKFREEFGALTGFARDTFNLLMKYGEEELTSIIKGEAGDNAFDTILEVIVKPEFRYEFDGLIDAFDTQTYVINLSLSLVNSIVNNLDTISFTSSIGDDEKELIQLIFKKGYLSANIPDERKLIEEGGLKDGETRPYLNVARLIDKKDVKIALNLALSLIAEKNADDDTMSLVRRILPEVSKLSLLSNGRKGEVDPVLGRLYCLVENKYLTAEGQDGVCYSDIAEENIDWVGEINTLLDVSGDALDFYDNVSGYDKEGTDLILYIFDEENPDCVQNIALYDNICKAVTDSKILGKALSASLVYEALNNAYKGYFENAYLSKDIVYSNSYDEDGKLVPGETYKLLYGLRFLAVENSDYLHQLVDFDYKGDLSEILPVFSDIVMMKDDRTGFTMAEYLTESEILRSVLSIALIESSKEGNTFYIPQASLEKDKDGKTVSLINKPELKELLENMDELVNFVMLFVGDGNAEGVNDFLNDDAFYNLVCNNRIFEGTVAQTLYSLLPKIFVIPAALQDNIDGWVTVNGKQGEFIRLLDAVKIAGFDVYGIISDGSLDSEEILKKLVDLSEKDLEKFLNSSVMHYTVSDYVLNGPDGDGLKLGDFTVIVPLSSRQLLQGDEIDSLVRKSELITAFSKFTKLIVTDDGTPEVSDVLEKLIKDRSVLESSRIVSATVVNALVSVDEEEGILSLPESLKKAGSREALDYYDSTNPWQAELKNLLTAFEELLYSEEEGFVLSESAVKNAITQLLTSLSTDEGQAKLDVCYASEIFRNKLTVELDNVLSDIVPASVLNSAKSGGYYTRKELQTLCDALTVFGVEDVLSIDRDKLTQNVKERVLHINEPLDGFGGLSTLDVVYPSKIISYLISDELDNVFEKNGVIDLGLLFQIKNYDKIYPCEELSLFVEALNALGLEDFDGINFDYEDLFDNEDKLNTVYSSDLAAGIITKAVKDHIAKNDVLCDHPKAYREGIAILNKSELESVISVFGAFDSNKIDLEKIGECIYDEQGKTSSYIIVASLSKMMLSNNALIIPPEAIERLNGEKYILPQEIKCVADVLNAYGVNDVKDWTEETPLYIPDEKVRQSIYNSEIMRARIVWQLVESTDKNLILYVDAANGKKFKDQSDNPETSGEPRVTISAEQLEALVNALLILNDGQDEVEFKLNASDFTPEKVIQMYQNGIYEELVKSDIIRYLVYNAAGYEFEETVLDLRTQSVIKVKN